MTNKSVLASGSSFSFTATLDTNTGYIWTGGLKVDKEVVVLTRTSLAVRRHVRLLVTVEPGLSSAITLRFAVLRETYWLASPSPSILGT